MLPCFGTFGFKIKLGLHFFCHRALIYIVLIRFSLFLLVLLDCWRNITHSIFFIKHYSYLFKLSLYLFDFFDRVIARQLTMRLWGWLHQESTWLILLISFMQYRNLSRSGLILKELALSPDSILQQWLTFTPQVTLVHLGWCDLALNSIDWDGSGCVNSWYKRVEYFLGKVLNTTKKVFCLDNLIKLWLRHHTFLWVHMPD